MKIFKYCLLHNLWCEGITDSEMHQQTHHLSSWSSQLMPDWIIWSIDCLYWHNELNKYLIVKHHHFLCDLVDLILLLLCFGGCAINTENKRKHDKHPQQHCITPSWYLQTPNAYRCETICVESTAQLFDMKCARNPQLNIAFETKNTSNSERNCFDDSTKKKKTQNQARTIQNTLAVAKQTRLHIELYCQSGIDEM